MKLRAIAAAACFGALALGCASAPDRFYTLNTLPERGATSGTAPALHVFLDTSIPVLDDRREMVVIPDANRVSVLDHERWAAPLADLVNQTIARDLERRRADVLVAGRGFDRPDSPPLRLKVDIVRMTAVPGRRASIEARWRLIDGRSGLDKIGSGVFDAPLDGTSYELIARAYSVAIGQLADALIADFPRP